MVVHVSQFSLISGYLKKTLNKSESYRYMLTGLGRKNWRSGFRECYFGKNTYFGITKAIEIPGKNLICQSSNFIIPSVSLYE